jgi:hypothetical protein
VYPLTLENPLTIDSVQRNADESPLLSLPPEIRNSIFRLVVQTSSGYVFLRRYETKSIVTSSVRQTATEANVLQQVCKQMRAETRHLELRANEVRVEGHVFAELMRKKDLRLQKFTGVIQLQQVKNLRSLDPDTELLHDGIFKFARDDPAADVTVIVDSLSFTSLGATINYFLCIGWTIERVVRGMKRSFPGVRRATKNWQGDGKDLNLPNLRFKPAVFEFNKTWFIQSMRTEHRFVAKYALKHYEGSEEKLVEAVWGWYRDGI